MVVGNGERMKEIPNIHVDKVSVLFNKRQALKCLSFGKMFSLGANLEVVFWGKSEMFSLGQIWKLFSGANLRCFLRGKSGSCFLGQI